MLDYKDYIYAVYRHRNFSKAAQELSQLVSVTWNNHPLAQHVMMGIFDYLGEKCKAGGQA